MSLGLKGWDVNLRGRVLVVLYCCGRGGKTTKVPDFRAAITVTTLTMNENAFSLPKTVDFTPRTEPLKFCRFRPILAIFSESVK